MLNKVPYSKAQFWQALLFSLSFVTVCQLSSPVDALPTDQDATNHEDVEIPDTKSSIGSDGEEGQKEIINYSNI